MKEQTKSDKPVEEAERLISSLSELVQTIESEFSCARQKIQLFTHNLDQRILNFPRLESLLKSFIRSSPHARVEALIYDERNLQNIDHCLLRLAQNFPSYIQIKIVPNQFQQDLSAFYLIDGRSLLYRNLADQYQTEYLRVPNFKVKEKSKLFNEIWQQSEPASHIRALYI